MRLGGRWLVDVADANNWRFATNPPQFVLGDTQTLYFQLVDEAATVDGTFWGGNAPTVRRYMPAAGASLTAVFDSVEDARKVTRVLSQPFALDASIWRIDVATTDVFRGTVTVRLTLNESGIVHQAIIKGDLRIDSGTRI